MVTDIVIIGQRQRHVDHAENQQPDSQDSCPMLIDPQPRQHDPASFLVTAPVREDAQLTRAGKMILHFLIMS
jgi:hypothetical protein